MANGIFNLKQVNQAIQQNAWTGRKTPSVDYLVVAGGGAGGGGYGGGGGGGGFLTGSIPVVAGSAITVTVGAGGTGNTGQGPSGSNSVFGSIVAIGGGGGCAGQSAGSSGGSGGGNGGGPSTSGTGTIGAAVAGQGNPGGVGGSGTGPAPGGGGGAGSRGISGQGEGPAGAGGAGASSAITGTVTAYAGGGGSGAYNRGASGYNGPGGSGGGGAGADSAAVSGTGTAGTANTGGGGGGASINGGTGTGGSGGSGIVVISYPDNYIAATSTTGSPTVSTSGSGSLSFNGSTQYFYYGGQSAFAFGTGDFTIEGWYYFNDVTTTQILYDFRAASTNGNNPCVYISSNLVYYYPAGAIQITGTTSLSTGTWYHIAVCRSGTSTKLFVNGVQQGSTYTDSTNYAVGASRPMIGSNGFGSGSSAWMNGYMSNVRMLKGTALYTAAFTPPTAPLTPITNTSLLLNTVSGSPLADISTNGYTVTVNVTPTWNQLSPFATGLGYKNRVYTWTSSGSITF